MTRPRYESEQDRVNEAAAIRRFAAWLGGGVDSIEVVNLIDEHGPDWLMMKMREDQPGVKLGWAEVKTRRFAFGKYPTHFVAELKWKKMAILAELGFDVFVLFALLDGLYWHKLDGDQYEVKMAGRKDRGDPADVEPIVHVPKGKFNKLSSLKVGEV